MAEKTVGRIGRIAAMFAVSLLILQGCAGFGQRLERPEVKIASLGLLQSEGLRQRFSMGLLLSNPNPVPLPIVGMSYSLSLNGYNLLTGVSPEVPTIPAYSEVAVKLEGSADLMAALGLLSSLAGRPQDRLRYELNAKIDLQGWRPTLNITEEGLIALRQ